MSQNASHVPNARLLWRGREARSDGYQLPRVPRTKAEASGGTVVHQSHCVSEFHLCVSLAVPTEVAGAPNHPQFNLNTNGSDAVLKPSWFPTISCLKLVCLIKTPRSATFLQLTIMMMQLALHGHIRSALITCELNQRV